MGGIIIIPALAKKKVHTVKTLQYAYYQLVLTNKNDLR